MGFPKIRGTILRVPIIRTIIYWGLYWGRPILGNYHLIKQEFGASSDVSSICSSMFELFLRALAASRPPSQPAGANPWFEAAKMDAKDSTLQCLLGLVMPAKQNSDKGLNGNICGSCQGGENNKA